MNCTAWSEKLHDYAEGELSPAEAGAVEAHLAACPVCPANLASLRTLLARAENLTREIAPARDLWPAIEARHRRSSGPPVRVMPRWLPYLASAAAGLAGLIVATRWNIRTPFPADPADAWSVTSLAGVPRVGEKNFQSQTRLRVGQWLETDHASSAKLAIGSIGEVNIEPNSRLRLIDASATNHRVELARGTLRALIWAPPRLFFVNTPSATAIDLGCAYTLSVNEQGDGLLHVTSGYVALEHDGREAIIPAGLACMTRHGTGPGTPFAADAPAGLRAALARFDFEKNGAAALTDVLAQARPEDAITLWHLLARAEADRRGDIFDSLARLQVPPPGVTRAGIVAGDAAMRTRWASALGLGGFAPR